MPRYTLETYLASYYATEIVRNKLPGGGETVVARLKRMPRCLAQADSEDDALRVLDGHRRKYIEARFDRGVEIADPDVVVHYSTRFTEGIPAAGVEESRFKADRFETSSLDARVVAM